MESRLSYNCVDRATVFDPVYLLLLMTLPNHHPTLLAQLLLPCPHASCVPGGAERLDADDDVVDGDVNEFDEVADEAHDQEAYSGGQCDLLEFFGIRLGAAFDKTVGVESKLLDGLDGSGEGRLGLGSANLFRGHDSIK